MRVFLTQDVPVDISNTPNRYLHFLFAYITFGPLGDTLTSQFFLKFSQRIIFIILAALNSEPCCFMVDSHLWVLFLKLLSF